MSLGIRSLHDSWTCGCFQCFVLLVPIADVKHCAEVCEWFLCIRMERWRARHALGEKEVAGYFACDRDWPGYIPATPRIACHVFIGSKMVHPRGVDSHGVSCVLDVILGSFLMYLNAKRLAGAKELEGGMCDVLPFRLHVLGIPQTWKCRLLVFVQVHSFWGHFWNTKYWKKWCHNIHGKLKRSCVSPFATCHLRVLLHSAVAAPVINSWSKQWETYKSQLLDFCRYLYLGKSCNLIAIFNWAVAQTLIICSVYRIRLPM